MGTGGRSPCGSSQTGRLVLALQDEIRRNFFWIVPCLETYPEYTVAPYMLADMFNYLNMRYFRMRLLLGCRSIGSPAPPSVFRSFAPAGGFANGRTPEGGCLEECFCCCCAASVLDVTNFSRLFGVDKSHQFCMRTATFEGMVAIPHAQLYSGP